MTRRLHAVAAGSSGRSDISELSTDIGQLLSAGIDATTVPDGKLYANPTASEARVWVMTVNAPDGGGYISVHTTEDGARAKLAEIVERWGLEDLLAADELDHSIGYLPVETP